MLESIARVVYRVDLVSGRFDYISGAAGSLFGLTRESIRDAGIDLVGRHMLPGDYEAALSRIAEVSAAHPGQSAVLELHGRLVGADGRVRDCHDSMTIEVDPSGKPLAVFRVVVDVSERLRYEAEM